MKTFNAFQIVVLFVMMPFLITWLHRQEFYASQVLFWVAAVIYLVLFIASISAMRGEIEKW